MRFYKATGTIRLFAGIALALSAKQVQLREHLLTVAEDGTLTAKEPVEFKAGEIIGFEQEPRGLLPLLELVEFDDLGDVEMVGVGSVGADSSAQSDKPKSGNKKPNKAKTEADGKITGLRITSSVDGVQCAGREWTGVTDVPVVDLSVEQVTQLMAATELTVTDVLIDADSGDQGE